MTIDLGALKAGISGRDNLGTLITRRELAALVEIAEAAKAYQSETWGTIMEGEALQGRLDRALKEIT